MYYLLPISNNLGRKTNFVSLNLYSDKTWRLSLSVSQDQLPHDLLHYWVAWPGTAVSLPCSRQCWDRNITRPTRSKDAGISATIRLKAVLTWWQSHCYRFCSHLWACSAWPFPQGTYTVQYSKVYSVQYCVHCTVYSDVTCTPGPPCRPYQRPHQRCPRAAAQCSP